MTNHENRHMHREVPTGTSHGGTAVEMNVRYVEKLPPPSVGRIVHYVSHGTPVRGDGTQAFESVCRAAVVTEVVHDGQVLLAEAGGREHSSDEVVVGLCVLNPTGQFFGRAAQDEDSHAGGTWHWPERV